MEDTTYTKDLVLVNMHLKSKLEKPLKLSKRKEKPTKKSGKPTKFSPIKKLANNTMIDIEKEVEKVVLKKNHYYVLMWSWSRIHPSWAFHHVKKKEKK